MQTLTGRVTKNATVTTVKGDKQVVNFSIALNNSYTPKGGERVEQVTFVDCSYWRSAKVAEFLKKGTVVEVAGYLRADAYLNRDNKPIARINFHTHEINLHGGGRNESATTSKAKKENTPEPVDDLPF